MQTESLDTNLLLRLCMGDIPAQQQKVFHLLNSPNKTFYVADLAISEMVYVLETGEKYSRNKIAEYIKALLVRKNINCNRPLFRSVLPFYETHPKISFNDCCLAAYAALNQSEPLWTFDRKFAVQSGTAKLLS